MKKFVDVLFAIILAYTVISFVDVFAYQGAGGTQHGWNLIRILMSMGVN